MQNHLHHMFTTQGHLRTHYDFITRVLYTMAYTGGTNISPHRNYPHTGHAYTHVTIQHQNLRYTYIHTFFHYEDFISHMQRCITTKSNPQCKHNHIKFSLSSFNSISFELNTTLEQCHMQFTIRSRSLT